MKGIKIFWLVIVLCSTISLDLVALDIVNAGCSGGRKILYCQSTNGVNLRLSNSVESEVVTKIAFRERAETFGGKA